MTISRRKHIAELEYAPNEYAAKRQQIKRLPLTRGFTLSAF
ncbi:hypothetical protein [Parapedobacter composti]|nr:hypothetical protein [Parapedobacter composti]